MKKLLLASTALVIGGPVFAADMPVKAPPVAAPAAYSWSACYVGGHIGAGWSHAEFSDPGFTVPGFGTLQNFAPAGSTIDVNGHAGALGGVQAGCDYQFASNWVIGLAGDFSWANIRGQDSDPFFAGKNPGPVTLNSKTDELATITGRLGYAWDHTMVYAKGGGAWAHDRDNIQNQFGWGAFSCTGTGAFGFGPCNPSGTDTRLGWTAGVGVEWAFSNHWSALLEYDHYGFGTKSVALFDPNAGPGGTTGLANVSESIDAVKVGVNYRFGMTW
jgi:outer membrane immunogenic protein